MYGYINLTVPVMARLMGITVSVIQCRTCTVLVRSVQVQVHTDIQYRYSRLLVLGTCTVQLQVQYVQLLILYTVQVPVLCIGV